MEEIRRVFTIAVPASTNRRSPTRKRSHGATTYYQGVVLPTRGTGINNN